MSQPAKLVLLLAALLLGGCGARPYAEHYQVVIDPTFTDEESGRIVSALDAWTTAVGVTFDVVYGTECDGVDDRICVVPAVLRQGLDGLTYRCNQTQGSVVWLDRIDVGPTGNREWYDYVLRHEFGHALGLLHTQAGTLMYKFIGPDPTISCADRQQYWDLRRLTDLGCSTQYVLTP